MAQNNQIPQVEFLTPIGRLVQGNVWKLNTEDQHGNPLTTQDGKPKKQCYFALAIDKNNPEWAPFFARLAQVAQGGYPQFFNQQGQCVKADFAWKVSDGDGVDNDGKPNNVKPGWAGCWVVKFSSSFLPRCFEKGKYLEQQQLQDERSVKNGFFVRVGGLMSPNIGSKKPGLYLNADLVELNYVGEEIMAANIRDASAALGAAQAAYVPQGAMPIGAPGTMAQQQPGMMPQPQGMMPQQQPGMGGMMPQMASQGMQAAAMQSQMGGVPTPGMMPQPQGMMGGIPTPGMMGGVAQPGMMQMPGQQVQPNAGFVAGAMQAAGVPTPGMMQQQQPQYQPTPKAGAYTLDQFLQNGFNITQLLQEGYFVQV